MKNNYSIQKDNIPRFLEQISDALMFGNIENSEYIIKKIKKINTYGDACLLLNDDIASNWVPAIINGFFGRECYRKCDLNVDDNKTFLLITPCFLEFENLIIEELQKTIDCLIERREIIFSKELVSLIYGGFPWFIPYILLSEDLKMFDKKTIVYFIESNENGLIGKINNFKDSFRLRYPNLCVEKEYSNCEFISKIRSFHCPNKIENKLQLLVINKHVIC